MAFNKIELKEMVAMLKEQAELQAKINGSLSGFVEGLKDAKKLTETINRNEKIAGDVRAKITAANKAGNVDEEKRQKDILDILKGQNDLLKEKQDILVRNLKEVNKTKMLFAKGTAEMVRGVASLPGLFKGAYREIEGMGLFDMDKSIKQSALSMGLLTAQSKQFGKNIQAAAMNTTSFGVGAQELAKMQADYSEELGRSVMLDKSGLEAVGKIAAATALGAEGTAKMAADMEQQGISAERTAQFVQQAMQDSSSMGLNATKVMKNIGQNIKLLNKYNFKDGVNGLIKMAEMTAKLGIDMKAVAPMADKLFDIDGAVEMSSQLQVMGGAWAKLADPFKLMYMARNDMGALVEEIGKATEASVTFNKQKGDFEISALEMHRLRKVAEQTGIAYDTLADAGKNARKQTEVKSQVSISVDKDTKEFLANTAKFDKNGKAYIEMDVNGVRTTKFLDALDSSDATRLQTQMKEKKSLEQYAKDARTFDDALNNTVAMFKTMMFPIITTMDEKLLPKVDAFVKKMQDEKWIDKAGVLIDKVATTITNTLGWFIDNPKTAAGIVTMGALLPGLFEKANWFANGLVLSEGFMAGSKAGGFLEGLKGVLGGSGSSGGFFKDFKGLKDAGDSTGGDLSSAAKWNAGSMLRGAGGTAAGVGLGGLATGLSGRESTTTGTVLGELGGAGGWAAAAELAPESFGASLLILLIASGVSKYLGDMVSQPVHDGMFGKTGGNNGGRGIIQNGQITPIDNKDDLLAMKPNGPVDRAVNNSGGGSSTVKHEFSDLKITGDVVISTPGGGQVSSDLLKNPDFIRNITSMITVEIQKNKNQVQRG